MDAATGAQRSTVELGLSDLRFSMAGVLLRMGDFVPAAPAQSPLSTPATAERGGGGDEEGLDFSLLSSADNGGGAATVASASSPPSPPSSLSLRLRMARPTFQLVADPTIPFSPALLFSWTAAVALERSVEGGRERLKVSGGLQRVTCHVTELSADDEEVVGGPEGQREAALVLAPFDATVDVTRFSSPSSLPRRAVLLTVEPILLRLSYSSYRLVSSTLSGFLRQRRPGHRGAALQLSTRPVPSPDEEDGDDVSAADAVLDEFAVTEVASDEATQQVPLFAEDDVRLRLQSVQVLLINDCVTSDLPLARLMLDGASAELHSFSHHRNVRGRLQLSVDVFDEALVSWLPLLEPYRVNGALSSSLALQSQAAAPSAFSPVVDGGGSGGALVRGSLTHWLQVTSPQALNVNVSHAMVLSALDALHLFTASTARDRSAQLSTSGVASSSQPNTPLSSSSSSSSLLSTGGGTPTSTSRRASSFSPDTLPFRIDNHTEFELQCHGLYSRREAAPGAPTSSSAASAASQEFGPWAVAAHSSLPFSFPSDASPLNQSLLVEFSSPATSPSAPAPFTSLTAPFSRSGVTTHRMPGRGASSVVVVTEVFIAGGVKVCRVRSRVGLCNRTEVAFEFRADASTRGWPTLRPHSTFFLPLLLPPSTSHVQLRPQVGGFDFCAPLPLTGEVAEETVSRLTCARSSSSGLPSTSAASLSFSGDFHSVLCGLSLQGPLRLHGPVEEEVARSRAKKAGAKGWRLFGEEAEQDEEATAATPQSSAGSVVHSTVFTLRPPCVVENLLPLAAELRCVERSKERADQIRLQQPLDKGGRLALFAPSAASLSSLCFRLPGLQQSQWSASLPLLGDRDSIERALQSSTVNVLLKDDDKRELVVHASYALQQGCVVVSLYVPYWLFDETGLGLVPSADRTQLVPMGGWEELQVSMLRDERAPLLFNFPPSMLSLPAEQKTVALTTFAHLFSSSSSSQSPAAAGASKWSRDFNVDTVGFRFSASIPGVREADGGQSLCEVGVSIQQGSGRFRRTKMVVCTPRLMLVNSLPCDAEVRQHGTTRPLRIRQGQQEAWQWPSAVQKRFLALRRVGSAELEGWEWSGVFNPAKVGAVNLLVRHSTQRGQYWYLRVESRMQDSTCFCVLSAFPQELSILRSVLPYRVHNRALFHSVRFRQVKDGVSYGDWIVVEPQSSFPYAWEQPLLAGEVELQLGLRHSPMGERWEDKFVASFEPPQQSQPPTAKRLKPLPGDETRAEQALFVQAELFGPTRVLVVGLHPSLEAVEEELRRGARQRGRKLSRRELNEALRARQQSYLQSSIELLDAQLLQLAVTRAKMEEKAQGLASGVIERPGTVAAEDSALLVAVKAVRGLQAGLDVFAVVDFNGSKAKTEVQRVDAGGEAAFEGRETAAFRANNLRLSTACRVTLYTKGPGGGDSPIGSLEFSLFEYDDHQRRQQLLSLYAPSAASASAASAAALKAEVDVSVWWIPPAAEEVQRLLAELAAVERDWRRVKAAVKAELKRVVRGRLEGVVGSANTEVLFLVRVTGLTGVEAIATGLPAVGGRLVVRVASELTLKQSSALLYQHDSNIRLALAAASPTPAGGVVWGHTLPFLVSEDLLDARGGEVLHFTLLFSPAVSSDDAAPPPAVEVAAASIPLNDVPVSKAEAATPSPEEAAWTQRAIPLQAKLPLSRASAAAASSSRGELAMTATFRRFPARSDEQRAELKMTVQLPSVGVSLITDAPDELLYLSAHRLSLNVEQGQALQTLFLRVDDAQLDNQRDSAIFPVVLAPSYVPPEERQSLLQLSVTKQRGLRDAQAKAQYAVWSFPYFSLLVQSLDVRVEEGLVWALVHYANEFAQHRREGGSAAALEVGGGRLRRGGGGDSSRHRPPSERRPPDARQRADALLPVPADPAAVLPPLLPRAARPALWWVGAAVQPLPARPLCGLVHAGFHRRRLPQAGRADHRERQRHGGHAAVVPAAVLPGRGSVAGLQAAGLVRLPGQPVGAAVQRRHRPVRLLLRAGQGPRQESVGLRTRGG